MRRFDGSFVLWDRCVWKLHIFSDSIKLHDFTDQALVFESAECNFHMRKSLSILYGFISHTAWISTKTQFSLKIIFKYRLFLTSIHIQISNPPHTRPDRIWEKLKSKKSYRVAGENWMVWRENLVRFLGFLLSWDLQREESHFSIVKNEIFTPHSPQLHRDWIQRAEKIFEINILSWGSQILTHSEKSLNFSPSSAGREKKLKFFPFPIVRVVKWKTV